MIIKPSKVYFGTISVPYCVPSDWRKFVYDSENRVFEITDNLEMLPCGKLYGLTSQRDFTSVAFHPRKEIVAFVTENGMTVSDFHGNRIWEYKAPVSSLLFSRSGDEVWIAQKVNGDKLLISVVETESGMENSANTMEDSLYDSSLLLYHAPGTVLLELAAGQDGCEIWELDDTNPKMRYRVVFPNHSHVMPVFHPDEKHLLTLENDEQLFYSYSWPDTTLVAKQRGYTETEREDEETTFGYSMIYLKNGLAVIQSGSGRLYLFDPVKMERVGELVIDGLEPVPTNKIFPNLSDESLFSPIERIERLGNILVAITGKHIRKQKIALFTEDELIKQI